MPARHRPLPTHPSLRYLKLAAKRRLAAAEFPSLQWVIARFADADEPTWTPPGEQELLQHFSEQFLTVLPARELVAQFASSSPDLHEELLVVEQEPLVVRARIAGAEVIAVAEEQAPHRLAGLHVIPLGGRITDARAAAPPTRVVGDVPPGVAAIADDAYAKLGPAALVIAGGDPGRLAWAVGKGWANLERSEALDTGHLLPASGLAALVTVTAVLRLAGDGHFGLDSPANDLLRTVRLADDTITVRELLSHSSGIDDMPANPAELSGASVTGYTLTAAGAFEPVPATVCTLQAAGGLWATAADLVRLGTGWSSLLPAALACEALAPQAASESGEGHAGLGWLIRPRGDTAVLGGLGPDGIAALTIRLRDNRTHLIVASRLVLLESVDDRLLRSWTNPSPRADSAQSGTR